MTYRVVITAPALEAIRSYARYIAVEQRAPESAARWLGHVLDAADSLETMPRRCGLAPEDAHRPYEVRWIAAGEFMLLFTVVDESETVWVLNGRPGHRQPARLPSRRAV